MKDILKKIATYGIIASFAFILAVPVLARESEMRNGNDGDEAEGDSTAKPTLFMNQIREEAREQIQERRAEIKEKMEQAKEEFKQQREEAKNKFEEAREQYKQKIEEVKLDRKELVDSIKNAAKVRQQEAKNKVYEKAHNMLGNTVGAMINRLNALTNKVNGAKLLDADRTEILAEIKVNTDWLKAKQAEIQAMASSTTSTASTTAQAIKEKSKEVKAYWETVKVTVKRVSGEILAGRLNYIVSKEEELANTLTTEVATLKAAGKDVATLETSIAETKAKIVTAKAKIAEAKAKFKTITTPELVKTAYSEGQNIIKEAKSMVNEIHRALVKVKNGANAINGNDADDDDDDDTATSTATSTTP